MTLFQSAVNCYGRKEAVEFTVSSSSKTLCREIIRKYEIETTAKCRYEELYLMLELLGVRSTSLLEQRPWNLRPENFNTNC